MEGFVRQELSDEQRSVLSKVEKLLRLSGKTTSPDEAASAARKAQDLLLAYNLSAAALGAGDEGRRGQEKLAGGFYEYERSLMYWVAEINFCLHWVSRDWVRRPENEQRHARVLAYRDRWTRENVQRHQHHLVGRLVNVEATQRTYRYLTSAIERLTREFIAQGLPTAADDKVVGLAQAMRSRRAVSFREGAAEAITDRLWQRRSDQLAEERRRERAEAARAAEAAASGLSVSTALTISSLRQSEEDANHDLLYGEGWSARQRAEAAARAEAARIAEEEWTRWAAEHPEEAARQEAERLAEARKRDRRRGGGPGSRGGMGKEVDWAAQQAGRAAGETVGLDEQVGDRTSQRRIAG